MKKITRYIDDKIADIIYDMATSSKYNFVDLRWKIKLLAIKLRLYKPNNCELECIEHNKKIKK